jgi:2-keto-4-pentenoate hydratase/2-oxohepta-3-ene-1,7-dioic acid hydratase in catechol pathway
MKLVTIDIGQEGHHGSRGLPGVLLPDQLRVLLLQEAHVALAGVPCPHLDNMRSLLDGGPAALDMVSRLVEASADGLLDKAVRRLADVCLLAPVPVPNSIRDCMAFERHYVQAARTISKWKFPPLYYADWLARRTFTRGLLHVPRTWREMPVYYKGNPRSVVGPGADVHWPDYSEKLDFELEFGIFIGKQGRDISEADARSFIAGYCLFNDFSARDIQLREMQARLGPAKGKDFETGNAMGPYLVTPEEIADPYALTLEAWVNSNQWSVGSTVEMHFTFEQMIAHISRCETIYPGDFIGSGTVPGGSGLDLDRWLKPGDIVELRGGPLGTLANRIVRDGHGR